MMHHAMNQLCKVCGEPAAGFHFGAFTCEGCKSFFGRTYNNLSSLSECKNNGRCIINKKNRTSCKSCRLRKCLLVGMSKSGSRYGRRSNWFKIHCLLQDQAALHHATSHHPLDSSGINGFGGATKMGYESGSSDDHRLCQDEGVPSFKEERSVSPESRDSSCEDRTTSNGNRLLSPYDASPSPPTSFSRRDTGPSAATSASATGGGSAFLVHHQLPISPISPISPLHPQTKFVFTPAGACYLHTTNGLAFPTNAGKISPYHPRPPPYLSMGDLYSKSTPKLICEGTPPEQDDPIDLSVRGSTSQTPIVDFEGDEDDDDEDDDETGSRKRRQLDGSDVTDDDERGNEMESGEGRGLPLDLSTK